MYNSLQILNLQWAVPLEDYQHDKNDDTVGFVPILHDFDSAEQIDMTGGVLFDHVFDVIRFQCLLKLSPRYKIFDLDHNAS